MFTRFVVNGGVFVFYDCCFLCGSLGCLGSSAFLRAHTSLMKKCATFSILKDVNKKIKDKTSFLSSFVFCPVVKVV